MPDASTLPGWPRCLGREQAAAYLGVSTSTFDAEVKAGRWPGPDRRGARGGRVTWDRVLLDATQDRHSRLAQNPADPYEADAPPHEADAWKERISGTSQNKRPQVRPQASR